ncbi:uncharacterized protein LOC119991167 isoform X1 [Tripterygium wilfordii]|nr:uncharacterized protein LOC119991167 isoform X1 [Tripterygium wilfordii]XP_038693336.1 uncharacterized protein LOC119991167 isoform X1 [Tripterygium wilfordii]XP_038693337.1 uncharacterized protein LOC119991167 isoform X1 [Tripterygium wilfordii]
MHSDLHDSGATMSDEGEKTCPLCAEEMDLTDQQLKPCKCGYEICVWCWHHIMDMAEKDESEGRCPACRAPYDKEKIVGTAANCERLVAEISMERKTKSQKMKTKSLEGRKHLSSVRVIQRNLVYIVGLPLNLADEDLLQHREYFGQYGKVLKVSMSRTAAGVIQQFPNNTCSVYITFSKEEEAVRCIQSVHGFVLEGKPLKACFGTTKYCHAWLRNVPCSNPDCLYLHEVGSHEDSFTKDEIISAYTRSRVQQITCSINNLQRRLGNVLPPPVDDYFPNSSASTAKPIVKNASNNTAGSPPNVSSGSSVALPAAASWGMRALNQPPVMSLVNGPSKQKPDAISSALAYSSAVASTTQGSMLHSEAAKKPTWIEDNQTMIGKCKPDTFKVLRQLGSVDCRDNSSEKFALQNGDLVKINEPSRPPSSMHDERVASQLPNVTNAFDQTGQSFTPDHGIGGGVGANGDIQSLFSDMSLMCIDRTIESDHSDLAKPSNLHSDQSLVRLSSSVIQGSQQHPVEQCKEPLALPAAGQAPIQLNGVCIPREGFDLRTDLHAQHLTSASSEVEDDILSFDNQRLKDPEVVSRSTFLPNSANSLHISNLSRSHSLQHTEAFANVNVDPLFADSKVRDGLPVRPPSDSAISNGISVKIISGSVGLERNVEGGLFLGDEARRKGMGRFLGDAESSGSVDTGESSIISNILSLDIDALDDSLRSPQNLAKLLGESERQPGSHTMSSSWKVQNNQQSRFSFARQEESSHSAFGVEPPFSVFGHQRDQSFFQDLVENRDIYMDKLGIGNGFSSNNFGGSDNFSSAAILSPNKMSAVSRSQNFAPPGFSVPNRAPPPGFSSHERVDQTLDSNSGNHLLDSSSLLRNSYQAPQTGNMGSPVDIEFMDPAILAVGKGRLQGTLSSPSLDMRPNFPTQFSAFENDTRLQLLMQRSLSPHQNMRYTDMGDNFSSISDSYGISPWLVDQSQVSNLSPFAQSSLQQSRNALMSNGRRDGWNEVQGGNALNMAEVLRNERLGFNKFYNSYEDSNFRMPGSGDIYNRTFGM